MISAPCDPVARRRRTLLVIAVAALLVVWNNLVHLHPVVGGVGYIPVNLALTLGLVAVGGRAAGLDRRALGLDRSRLGPGLLAGGLVVGVVAVGLAIALAVPALRPLLEDGRFADRSTAGIVWHALVRVPFGTALLEEVAFRGVLLALLASLVGTRRAVVVSSVLFGLWHIRPAWGMAVANGADLGLGLATVAGSVAVTTVAGVAFCWLRLRTGHLAAPVVAHAGMNALATFAAHLALTWDA